jgi:hypothetical protein
MISLTDILTQAFANLISGLVANIVYILIAVWGFRLLGREIREGIKQIPNWLEQFEKTQLKIRTLDKTLERR